MKLLKLAHIWISSPPKQQAMNRRFQIVYATPGNRLRVTCVPNTERFSCDWAKNVPGENEPTLSVSEQ